MAAVALQRKPGLAAVMIAFAQFRKDLTSEVLNMEPCSCFEPETKLAAGTMRKKGKNMFGDKMICKAFDSTFDVQPTANSPSCAYTYTSRAGASRVAEVSRFKKCNAIGSKNKVCL